MGKRGIPPTFHRLELRVRRLELPVRARRRGRSLFVGRDREKVLLNSIAREEGSQFVAVYGRHGVGKTMLVRESFGHSFTFQHAGLARGAWVTSCTPSPTR